MKQTMLDCIEAAPVSAKKILERAFKGEASPRAAIKAMCLVCLDFDRSEIGHCTAHACPLWEYRPYVDSEPVGTANLQAGEENTSEQYLSTP
jgi:hypothetical protein